jgi:hypothetical protein
MIELIARHIRSAGPDLLEIAIEGNGLAQVVAGSLKCPCRVVIQRQSRPRTTGPRSQNRHVNGHCQQIAQETGNSFATVKLWAKTEAISEGYPMDIMPNGRTVPKSEADLNTVEAAILIETLHRLAAELNIRLVEEAT